MKEKNQRFTVREQITKYLDAVPPAIAGSRGHNRTFSVACSLYNGWALSEEDTLAWLKVYNERCEPKWNEKELAHKAASAAKAEHTKPRGHLLNPSIEQQRAARDWTISKKPIASGKIALSHPATLATLNSDFSRTRAHTRAKPLNTNDQKKFSLARARNESENNVANVAKTPESPENSKKSVSSVSEQQLTPEQLAEARRIADELIKLHERGIIKDADDPEAAFCAGMLKMFGGAAPR